MHWSQPSEVALKFYSDDSIDVNGLRLFQSEAAILDN